MIPVPDVSRWQDGVFTRAQAHAAGLSYPRIARLVRSGSYVSVVGAAYVRANTPITPRRTARALQLVTGGVVSHLSAAQLFGYGLPDGRHVTIAPARTLRMDDVRGHRLRLAPEEVVDLDGLAVTSRQRTVVDLLATLPLDQARTLQFRAMQQDWLRRDELAAAVRARAGWEGTPQLRCLLDESSPRAHSVLENRLHALLRRYFSGWEANVPVADQLGLIGIVDVLFAAARLVIEVDGRAYHADNRFQSDRTRQNRLIRAGYTVLRFTFDDVVHRPQQVIELIRATLARLLSA